MTGPVVEVRDLVVDYRTARGPLRAVDGVSFALAPGEALGIVGESGCGKSTLGRAVLGLVAPTRGRVAWFGRDLATLAASERRALRKDVQVVFQDPLASLDPRMTVGESVAEPLAVHRPDLGRAEVARRVGALLERVGLGPSLADRYPHELSGGQCQRAGIARAMIVEPRVVVCDEPVSALDVSIQGQIVNLFAELQRELGTALVFVSHNLAVVRHLCPRVLVMYLGRTMELAPREAIYARPLHPYTRRLLEAVPVPDPAVERARAAVPAGAVASPFAPPGGCAFRGRCPHAVARCAAEVPPAEVAAPGRTVACHRWREGVAEAGTPASPGGPAAGVRA